jgi:hypothetical protein
MVEVHPAYLQSKLDDLLVFWVLTVIGFVLLFLKVK